LPEGPCDPLEFRPERTPSITLRSPF
jgi:hypothetical protein